MLRSTDRKPKPAVYCNYNTAWPWLLFVSIYTDNSWLLDNVAIINHKLQTPTSLVVLHAPCEDILEEAYTNVIIHSSRGVLVWTPSMQLLSLPSPSSLLSSLYPMDRHVQTGLWTDKTFCCCCDVARERFLFLTRYSTDILYISQQFHWLLYWLIDMLFLLVIFIDFTARPHASRLNLYILSSISNLCFSAVAC